MWQDRSCLEMVRKPEGTNNASQRNEVGSAVATRGVERTVQTTIAVLAGTCHPRSTTDLDIDDVISVDVHAHPGSRLT